MKKILLLILSCAALFACNKSSEEGLGAATSVVLSKSKVDLHVGETATITATVHPTSLGMGVTWASLDEEIASVDNGVITAKAKGVTYVVATSTDGSKKAACMVSVNPEIRYSIAVKDELGRTLTGIYGYPGQTMKLTAYASDEQDHEFTMVLNDNSVGTLEADGTLTLAATSSTDPNFAYDAESFIKITSEDGYIYNLPVRSSLYNGIRFANEFKSAQSSITVLASQRYPFEVLYQGAAGPIAMAAEEANLTLSNSTDFSLEKEAGVYNLVTGANTDVETRLSLTLGGSTKVALADFLIEKYYEIEASLSATSSSTLVFTWTERVSAEEDIKNAYTATLYKDSECTEVDQTFDIPAGCGAWKGAQPKFVFGGLNPSTEYWFKVYDTTNNFESNKIKATTNAFTHVLMPASITTTGVVLAEDFGEIRWDFDYPNGAMGFRPSDKSSFANTGVKTSETNEGNNIYNGYHGQGGSEITFKSCGSAILNSRLNGWLSDTEMYVHPGYLKLGTSSKRGWVLTPEFTVPAGKKAVVKVTITAGRYSSGQAADWGVIVLSRELAAAESQGAHTAYFEWPDTADPTLYKEVTFDNNNSWVTKSVEGLVVREGDRIAFGGKNDPNNELTAKGRVHISDMTVEVLELLDE